MIIDSITTLNEANQLIINPLTNNNFLPLDTFTYDCIKNDRIDFLRQTTESENTYDEKASEYYALHECGDVPEDYGITAYPEISQFIYPYSKINLFKTIYPKILPSVINLYFNYMKNNNRVIQIGSGVGKCLIIKPVLFTKEDVDIIKDLDTPYSALAKLLVLATDHLAKQENDIKYLLTAVSYAEKNNQYYSERISKLELQLINTTMNTWS
ncbi:MAG: hypothetical protein O3A39_04710 [Proteobacteria bacterium]|nr:hypothetical protein [Pseudomonadota bacterium]